MATEIPSPNEFFENLRKRVRDQLTSDFVHLEEDLQQRFKAQRGSKDSTIPPKITKCTDELRNRMEFNYMRNIEKLRVYAMRNIFIPSKITVEEDNASQEMVEVNDRANEAKDRFSKAKLEHDVLVQEIREMETLLKDMKAAMFDLRVGSQTFEEVNLVESVARLAEHQSNLEALCDKSQVIVDQLNASKPKSIPSASLPAFKPQSLDTSIVAGDLSDIVALSSSLR